MADFRDPNDQFYGNSGYEPSNDKGTRWGWIVGAAFLVVVLGLAFGVGHQPTRVASNDNINSPITTPARPEQPDDGSGAYAATGNAESTLVHATRERPQNLGPLFYGISTASTNRRCR